MTKRLHTILTDREYHVIQKAARSRGISVSAWVRQALERAGQNEPAGDVAQKLAVIRHGVTLNYPAADIDQMLAEIGQGYSTETVPTPDDA